MSDIIRNEAAHTINGVPGRMFTLRRPPAPWKAGTFANQKWVSESRPIAGYGPGAKITVKIRFDDDCRNGHNTFAITADVVTPASLRRHDVEACGCLHNEIAEVFPELAHMIRWHLCSTDGPMHYVANTLYHARQHGPNRAWVYFTGTIDPLGIGETKERLLGYRDRDAALKAEGKPGYRVEWDEKTAKVQNLEYARSSACWPDATDEELNLPAADLEKILMARLPGLLCSMRADIEAAGFMWECPGE